MIRYVVVYAVVCCDTYTKNKGINILFILTCLTKLLKKIK